MNSERTRSVAEKAKILYEERLRADLETNYRDKYVAIEPESGEYFVASSYGESVMAAREAHPDRISFVIRIGHDAAIHLGVLTN